MRADALGLFWQDMPKIKTEKIEAKYLAPEPTWLLPTYLPYLEDALRFDVPLMTDQDLLEAFQNGYTFAYDIECYINYFLIAFKCFQTGKVIYFERIDESDWNDNPAKLHWIVHNICILGFNSIGYDIVMTNLALNGYTNAQLKAATNMIIGEEYKPWMILRKMKLKDLQCNHVDIMEVAPLFGSLKIYSGRAAAKRMQDLPFHPETRLTGQQISVTRFYCVNDLDNTIHLANKLKSELILREQMSQEYGVDLRSKSDAQIAEAVISHELEKLTGVPPVKPNIPAGTAYLYRVPPYLQYHTPLMNQLLDIVKQSVFVVEEDGSVAMPRQLSNLKVEIGGSIYKLGIGGLHSTEKKASHFADDYYELADVDVESYYPRIILNQGIFPQHLGRTFLTVFNSIVMRRLDAKHTGNKKTADSLKIVINGTFGKLGSKYSIFYSPDLLIQVTISGQLSLLMLIEALELNGISVVSANTDGIVTKCHRSKLELRDSILAWWEQSTNFKLEKTLYRCLCSKDVNNYFAAKLPGTYNPEKDEPVKRKGLYAKPGLSKNPTTAICAEAVAQFLAHGTPLEKTIKGCNELQMFVSVRNVTGGAVAVTYQDLGEKNVPYEEMKQHLVNTGWQEYEGGTWIRKEWVEQGKPYDRMAVAMVNAYSQARWMPVKSHYLGKAIRWYYATTPDTQIRRIVYAQNNKKVPKSDGAMPIMEFTEQLPTDIDYDWYLNEAKRILSDIGYPQ